MRTKETHNDVIMRSMDEENFTVNEQNANGKLSNRLRVVFSYFMLRESSSLGEPKKEKKRKEKQKANNFVVFTLHNKIVSHPSKLLDA